MVAFTPETTRLWCDQVCSSYGFDSSSAKLVAHQNNAVYLLPDAHVVVRIAKPGPLAEDRTKKLVRLMRWYKNRQAPTVQLCEDFDYAIPIAETYATFWEYMPPSTERTATYTELGQLMRSLHELGAPKSFSLSNWDPVGDVYKRLQEATQLGDSDREFLRSWCQRIDSDIKKLRGTFPDSCAHADAHLNNVIIRQDGQGFLCDFDATCIGSPAIDAASIAIREKRFKEAGAFDEYTAAYGVDYRDTPYWPLFVDARELKMVGAALPRLYEPAVRAQFQVRLGSIRDGDFDAKWEPYKSSKPNLARSPATCDLGVSRSGVPSGPIWRGVGTGHRRFSPR